MILLAEKSNRSYKLLELIKVFSKSAGCKGNIQKYIIFLYIPAVNKQEMPSFKMMLLGSFLEENKN